MGCRCTRKGPPAEGEMICFPGSGIEYLSWMGAMNRLVILGLACLLAHMLAPAEIVFR